jgi:hypothetical protein
MKMAAKSQKGIKKGLIYTPNEACILFLTLGFNILMLCLLFNYIGCRNLEWWRHKANPKYNSASLL